MNILVTDDEELAVVVLTTMLKKVLPDAEVYTAKNAKQAMKAAVEHELDIAFLDVDMPGMDGITLAKHLKEFMPKLNIIFVTAYADYAVPAARTYFSGFFVKPITEEMIKEALGNLRFSVKKEPEKGLSVRTFGEFEVFYDGKPLQFKRAASKELFAYLVHLRGASSDTDRLCEVLWPDQPEPGAKEHSYLRHLVSDLKHTLEDIGEDKVFIKERNAFSIAVSELKCDLYRFLDGDPDAVNEYTGEYMNQYEWALMPYTWKY